MLAEAATNNINLLFNTFQLLALVFGGGFTVFKMGRAVTRFEMVAERQAGDIKELKMDIKVMAEATLKLALQEERMLSISSRVTLMEKQIDDIRHGEGFIMPLGAHMPNPKG